MADDLQPQEGWKSLPKDWRLANLGTVCPEQFELYDNHGNTVAYFRLRWGHFTAQVPDASGPVVYEHTFEGDGYKGVFDGYDERAKYLSEAIEAVRHA